MNPLSPPAIPESPVASEQSAAVARDAGRPAPRGPVSDLHGISQLAISAVSGVTDIVEDMHRTIARLSPVVGTVPAGRARGISGLVYRSVRGVTSLVGSGLNVAFAGLSPLQKAARRSSGRREALLAALNGVLGDHLAATGSPLAIPMTLRVGGEPLEPSDPLPGRPPGGRIVVLVHGLCFNDLQWNRNGQDHGTRLAQDLAYTPIYLHYNTGLRISTNGRAFSATLETLVRNWPVPVEELVLVGHSMGGLVARSAIHYAMQADQAWLGPLTRLVCLGSPHHGSPLERSGNRVDMLLGISPYTAPFSRLGKIRSSGIQDLRHGNLLDEDWAGRDGARPEDARQPVASPAGLECYLMAATRTPAPESGTSGTRKPGQRTGPLAGDGLVPVASALGQHKNPSLRLPVPRSRQYVCHGRSHFDLLSDPDAYRQLRAWLGRGRQDAGQG